MTNLKLEGTLIPTIEEEYLKYIKLVVSLPLVKKQYQNNKSKFIEAAEYFYRNGFRILQVITNDPSIIREIKDCHRDICVIGGGGINSIEKAKEFIKNKSDYIVIERLFAKNPDLIKSFVKLFGNRLIVSIGDKNGALKGGGGVKAIEYARLLAKNKVKNIIYVSDKTKLKGILNLKGYMKVRNIIKSSIMGYSGGVTSRNDVNKLNNIGADFVVVGKALYVNKVKQINFSKGNGLVPAIIQDTKTNEVLMLGYINEKSLQLTLRTGYVHFWSRSRNKLWLKGEESGNMLKVTNINADCDNDSLLVKAELIGKNVCHTGSKSCFFNRYSEMITNHG